jgi:uncharacterized protein (TIGR03437 family)
VLNTGDVGTLVNWQADLLSGSDWATLNPTRGTASPGQPGLLTVTVNPNAASFPAGDFWALLRFVDSSSQGSPQYFSALLDIAPATAPAQPQLSDGFLYFSPASGSSAQIMQSFTVNTSSTTPVAFQVSGQADAGGQWLAAAASGNSSASTASPGTVNVTVNPGGLPAGIYKGQVNVLIGSILSTKDVTLVIPATTGAAAPESQVAQPRDAGCTPSALAITMGALSGNFGIPAGVPAILSAQVNDNCNNPIKDASVTATFANSGETPKRLQGDGVSNAYAETFSPTAPLANASITLTASRAPLQSATQVLAGTVQANDSPQPILSQGGTVNNLYPRMDAALAPGAVVSIFGSGLSSKVLGATTVPLPTSLNNTSVLVGATQVPLYYVSPGQVNAELPVPLPLACCQRVVVLNNGVPSLPQQITSTPVDPGVAYFSGTLLIAQRPDTSLVDQAHPAKPGEVLVMYLIGMGATNPSGVTGGLPPPGLAPTVVQPTVTVGTLPATVSFAGLSPTGIGLYQINFQVPPTSPAGTLDVVVQQGSVTANSTQLIVGTP